MAPSKGEKQSKYPCVLPKKRGGDKVQLTKRKPARPMTSLWRAIRSKTKATDSYKAPICPNGNNKCVQKVTTINVIKEKR